MAKKQAGTVACSSALIDCNFADKAVVPHTFVGLRTGIVSVTIGEPLSETQT
jgi:hypothetical protein